MGRRVLVVTSWGDPSGWGSACYVVDDMFMESRATLIPLLVKAYRELGCGGDVRVILIVLDTLLARCRDVLGERADYEYIVDVVRGYVMHHVGEFIDECIKSVESKYRDILLDLKSNLDRIVYVVVAPGVGVFSSKSSVIYRFNGLIKQFYMYVLCKVLKHVLEFKPNEIWLDLSHGINYMPTITYRAVVDVMEIVKLYGLNTVLKLYNSDPYPRGRVRDVVLKIHKLVEEKVERPLGALLPSALDDKIFRIDTCFNIPLELKKNISRYLRIKHKDLIELIYLSLRRAYPLLILDYIPRKYGDMLSDFTEFFEVYINKLNDLIDEVLSRCTQALKHVNEVHVNNVILRDDVDVNVFVSLFKLLASSSSVVGKVIEEREKLKKLNIMDGVNLKTIEDFTEEFLSKYSEVAIPLVNREVEEIMRTVHVVGVENFNEWRIWDTIKRTIEANTWNTRILDNVKEEMKKKIVIRYKSNFKPSRGLLDGDRTFIAHIGLRYNDIEIKYIEY